MGRPDFAKKLHLERCVPPINALIPGVSCRWGTVNSAGRICQPVPDMAAASRRVGLTVLAISVIAQPLAATPILSSISAPTASAASLALLPGTPGGLFGTAMLTPSFQTGRSFSDKFCNDVPRNQNVPPLAFNTVASSTAPQVLIPRLGSRPRPVGCNEILTFTVGSWQVGTQTEDQISAAVAWGVGLDPFYVYVTLPFSPSR
jgi:hypothetical protein